MLTREWATVREMADMGLPGVPDARALQERANKAGWKRPEWRNIAWRPREASGGGVEYHYQVLDRVAKLAWVTRFQDMSEANERARIADDDQRYTEEWRWFEQKHEGQKVKALTILGYLDRIEQLTGGGLSVEEAVHEVRLAANLSRTTIMNWRRRVAGVPRPHWLPFLVSKCQGNPGKRALCDERALDIFKSLWLRPEKPTIAACYDDLKQIAASEGLTVPSQRTFARWMKELDPMVVTLARGGRESLKEMLPAQERDRSYMHALEAVNADGHKWDIFVLWPDGTIARPMMACWQDLYSNLILSWRIDKSENTDVIQLALGDMVEKWGIPTEAYLDNGRAFASKRLTGGAKTRFRFKITEDEINGVMTVLGIKVHWTQPYSGRSKPIERAFGDMESRISKDVRFSGAYVGKNPLAKPENYRSRAIPLEEFLKIVSEGIQKHNARPNRNTAVCGGKKSFLDAFMESIAIHPVKRAVEAQRHLWLRAGHKVTTHKKDGSIQFMRSRYYAPFLAEHLGEQVAIRYDPQDLTQDIYVYSLSNVMLGKASVVGSVRFNSVADAAQTAQAGRQIQKATKMILDAERKLSPSDLADLMNKSAPEPEEDLLETKLVRPFYPKPTVVAGNTAIALEPDDEEEDWLIEANRQARPERQHLRIVDTEE